MAVTINDVAKEAGVSITTVSRFLNNNYPVKKETREAIERAIKKLDYTPNVMARSLITKKSFQIGAIVPGITNLFFPAIVEEIGAFTDREGYNISLFNSRGCYKEEKKIIENIFSRQYDGMIVIDPAVENLQAGYYDKLVKDIPLVILCGLTNKGKCNFVCYDEEVGTLEAFEYLLELGHIKIAFVRGDKSFSFDIKEGIYNKIIKENGLDYSEIINVGDGNSINVVDNTEKEVITVLNKVDSPTAIFACNDLMAVGVINACNKLSLNVPKDISVIGCDNTLLAVITHPKLTTIDLGIKGIGERAAQELLQLIEDKNIGRRKIVLDTKLIKRDSCTWVESKLII